jgi:hypothetical protein
MPEISQTQYSQYYKFSGVLLCLLEKIFKVRRGVNKILHGIIIDEILLKNPTF